MVFSNDVLRQIIVSHYSAPAFKKAIDDPTFLKIHLSSQNCIDDFNLYLKVDNNVIKEAYFSGVGCAISTASIDIMCQMITGQSYEYAKKLIDEFHKMMREESFDQAFLEEAIAFINTSKQPSRIKCATIGWDGLSVLINKDQSDKKE
ncbi:MAG: SUF system NifU family Fe-S cluster assembly protein [Erysipelotrichaceae bacterium]|jgi:nitrogen fixation NifU-like protein|nr:SUF system NifU family Fe-S cluster assembly protein [Erysipelotrichaceae bacterium]